MQLRDLPFVVPEHEYLDLEYMDWKSGGDTNFAPIATADGNLDCRGFWNKGDERPDKGARFTSNAAKCPTLAREVEAVGADFGRVRTIKLEPQDHDTAFRSFHRDDNNRFNPETDGWVVRAWIELTDFPESYMLLMDTGPDGLPDPATEVRLDLHRGARFLLDTQRLWHVVVHNGTRAALRVDLQLRERPRARRVGAVATAVASRELRERGFERGVEARRRLDHRVVADAVEPVDASRRAAPSASRSAIGHTAIGSRSPQITCSGAGCDSIAPVQRRSCTRRSSM